MMGAAGYVFLYDSDPQPEPAVAMAALATPTIASQWIAGLSQFASQSQQRKKRSRSESSLRLNSPLRRFRKKRSL
jgi:hypothetical protein